jgi:hypothetical protein
MTLILDVFRYLWFCMFYRISRFAKRKDSSRGSELAEMIIIDVCYSLNAKGLRDQIDLFRAIHQADYGPIPSEQERLKAETDARHESERFRTFVTDLLRELGFFPNSYFSVPDGCYKAHEKIKNLKKDTEDLKSVREEMQQAGKILGGVLAQLEVVPPYTDLEAVSQRSHDAVEKLKKDSIDLEAYRTVIAEIGRRLAAYKPGELSALPDLADAIFKRIDELLQRDPTGGEIFTIKIKGETHNVVIWKARVGDKRPPVYFYRSKNENTWNTGKRPGIAFVSSDISLCDYAIPATNQQIAEDMVKAVETTPEPKTEPKFFTIDLPQISSLEIDGYKYVVKKWEPKPNERKPPLYFFHRPGHEWTAIGERNGAAMTAYNVQTYEYMVPITEEDFNEAMRRQREQKCMFPEITGRQIVIKDFAELKADPMSRTTMDDLRSVSDMANHFRASNKIIDSTTDPVTGTTHYRHADGTFTTFTPKQVPEQPAENNPVLNQDSTPVEQMTAFDRKRSLHRIVRAMHDGHCPKCSHLAGSELFRHYTKKEHATGRAIIPDGHKCPNCGFSITAEEEKDILAEFGPYYSKGLEVLAHWRKLRLDRKKPANGIVLEDTPGLTCGNCHRTLGKGDVINAAGICQRCITPPDAEYGEDAVEYYRRKWWPSIRFTRPDRRSITGVNATSDGIEMTFRTYVSCPQCDQPSLRLTDGKCPACLVGEHQGQP